MNVVFGHPLTQSISISQREALCTYVTFKQWSRAATTATNDVAVQAHAPKMSPASTQARRNCLMVSINYTMDCQWFYTERPLDKEPSEKSCGFSLISERLHIFPPGLWPIVRFSNARVCKYVLSWCCLLFLKTFEIKFEFLTSRLITL